MQTSARILVIDDHPIVRFGLQELLSQEIRMASYHEASGVDDARQLLETQQFDLIILDLSLKKGSALDFIKFIRKHYGNIPVLVLSMYNEIYYAERALRVGANGYIMKEVITTHLMDAIHTVMSGEIYLSERMKKKLLKSFSGQPAREKGNFIAQLTDRELEVYQLIGQGLTTREIAEKLFLSIKTIETYKDNIKKKLKLSNSNELFKHAAHWHFKNI
ncbi:MAG: response regulator transcription factor [candidate division KSB1 bacterium]|nr:response regulator transcription factor [candidate division KSB1 bacterium]